MKRVVSIVVVLVLVAADSGFAQEFAKVGRAGAQFLEIGLGARSVALGEAFTALVDDAGAVFWNPGALIRVESRDLVASYVRWPADIIYSGGALAFTVNGVGTFAVSLTALTMGDMRVRTPFYPEGNGQMFTVSDFAGGISFARSLTDKFSVGGTFKYVFEKYWTYESGGWAIDFGTLYYTGFKSLVLGMSILNFGPQMKFGGTYLDWVELDEEGNPTEQEFAAYDLPLMFKFGMAMDLYETPDYKISAAVDGIHPNDNLTRLNAGLEAWFKDFLALRGGWKFNYDEESYSFGVGLKVPFGASHARIDYAFTSMGALENVHRGSFGISF